MAYPHDREDAERIVRWPQVFQAMPRALQLTTLVVAGSVAIEGVRAVSQMVSTIMTTIVQPLMQLIPK